MKQLVKLLFGSHLYGTSTPESDKDYKGVFLPDIKNIILNHGRKFQNTIHFNTNPDNTKNSKDDVDFENYSLHYFLQLAYKGETGIIDMLHAPDDMILETSDEWEFIRENRSKFYTKNISSFVGYAKTQANKYGIKGSRMNVVEQVIAHFIVHSKLHNYRMKDVTLRDVWSDLECVFNETEHIEFGFLEKSAEQDKRYISIVGRKFIPGNTIKYVYDALEKIYDNYGERAKQAKNNKNIDWKAVSHAFRVMYQVEEIFKTGDLKFPLKEADFLLNLKLGKFHFQNDNIAEKLDMKINNVQKLVDNSNFPSKVNQNFWNNWLLDLYL